MQDISAEEREKRIAATNANPWVQLARQGADVWNGFMCRLIGDKEWISSFEQLSNAYSSEIKIKLETIKKMDNKEYKRWKKKLNISEGFYGYTIDFKILYFTGEFEFSGFFLPSNMGVDFTGATFYDANFSFSIFCAAAIFSNVSFKERVFFNNAVFNGKASFTGAYFVFAVFNSAVFNEETWFMDANFLKNISSGRASFSMAQFNKIVSFKRAKFIVMFFLQIQFF